MFSTAALLFFTLWRLAQTGPPFSGTLSVAKWGRVRGRGGVTPHCSLEHKLFCASVGYFLTALQETNQDRFVGRWKRVNLSRNTQVWWLRFCCHCLLGLWPGAIAVAERTCSIQWGGVQSRGSRCQSPTWQGGEGVSTFQSRRREGGRSGFASGPGSLGGGVGIRAGCADYTA